MGRANDIAELSLLVRRNRLVTISDSGSIGKTRIALEVIAREQTERYDEAYFVDLAPLTSGARILTTIAATIGTQVTDAESQLKAIVASFRERSILLIVDNCEHVVVDAAFAIDAILQACANVTVIATSRHGRRRS